MAILKCVCVSTAKQTPGRNIRQGMLTVSGISGDIHCGMGIKQVSMLPYEKLEKYFEEKGLPVKYGTFGENLVVEGLEPEQIRVGQKYCCEDAIMEVTQIGSKWKDGDTYDGERICEPMEKDFIFMKVVHTGILTEDTPFMEY